MFSFRKIDINKMWYIVIPLIIILVVVLFVVYRSTSDDDSDGRNFSESYLPIAPPTLQYTRTIDAPRRNPDLFNSESKPENGRKEIPEDNDYIL